jgi:hypothetical protein
MGRKADARAGKVNVGGRPTIFGKRDGDPVRGRLTSHGTARFEASRKALAKLAGWEPEQVLDSDVIEFELRGETETRKFLAAKAKP